MEYLYKDFIIVRTKSIGLECFYIYKTDTKIDGEGITYDGLQYLSYEGKLTGRQDQAFGKLYMFSIEDVETALSRFYNSPTNLNIIRTQKEIV